MNGDVVTTSYNHPILNDKTYSMLQEMDTALALGIGFSTDVMQKLNGPNKIRNADEWDVADKAFCIVLSGYRGFLNGYIKAMAEKPRYFRLDYGKASDFERQSGFIEMPEHLRKDLRADVGHTQKLFTLHQIFNFMAVHAKHLNEPLSRKLPDAVDYDPKLREARSDGVRYATQFWQTIVSKISVGKNALDVTEDFPLPTVVKDNDMAEFNDSVKHSVERLKAGIDGLKPSPFKR